MQLYGIIQANFITEVGEILMNKAKAKKLERVWNIHQENIYIKANFYKEKKMGQE